MAKGVDNTADLVRLSVSTNIVAGAGGGACPCGATSPPANSVAFFKASCLLHFSYNSINWMASPVPALQLLLKQQ